MPLDENDEEARMDMNGGQADSGVVEAEVQVGAEPTRYLRAGRGLPVVLVLSSSATERLRLVGRFAAAHRVVAPMLPVAAGCEWPAATAVLWLRGIIEGLGLERPNVVLAPGLALLAERLASGAEWVGDVTIAAQD
jgi:hypothetical protein